MFLDDDDDGDGDGDLDLIFLSLSLPCTLSSSRDLSELVFRVYCKVL